MVRRPLPRGTGDSQPFFTRRSVLAWAAVFVVSAFVAGRQHYTRGANGALGAVAVACFVVSGLIVWIGGAVLAARMRSLLLLVAVAFLFPLGSVLAAIFSPPPNGPGPPRRWL